MPILVYWIGGGEKAERVKRKTKAAVWPTGPGAAEPPPGEIEPGSGVRIVVEYCEPCGFEATYLELASAVKEQYPGIEIESRLGGTGAFEIEINGQLVFSKLENGGFPYEKDVSIYNVGRPRSNLPLPWIIPFHVCPLAH